MNDLQRLLKLRNITCLDVAKETGLGHHAVQKTIKQATYTDKSGRVRVRKPRHIRQAIADYLGLTYDQAWGRQSKLVLRRLIKKEIAKQVEAKKQELEATYISA